MCREEKSLGDKTLPKKMGEEEKDKKTEYREKKISSTVKVRSKPGPVDFICMTFFSPGLLVTHCRRCRCDPWVGKIPWRRAWQPTPVFLLGEFHGQRPGGLQSTGLQRVRHN